MRQAMGAAEVRLSNKFTFARAAPRGAGDQFRKLSNGYFGWHETCKDHTPGVGRVGLASKKKSGDARRFPFPAPLVE
jgi:hypothetical protein